MEENDRYGRGITAFLVSDLEVRRANVIDGGGHCP
jgi:hypothetical protein